MHARAHAASAPDLALFASGWLFPRAKFLAKTAFSALSRAAKPVYGRKTGWLGLFGQRAVLSQPFAQTLSDALRKQDSISLKSAAITARASPTAPPAITPAACPAAPRKPMSAQRTSAECSRPPNHPAGDERILEASHRAIHKNNLIKR
ncbi:hypothetical protein AAFM71_18300 [Chromobacterium violaceum]|uniref:hypothetical protein n=1 Tax=Chromobacterium violaceum TaxID=536 RepID=UPI003857F8C0